MAGSDELGAHMSIAGGRHLALERGHALGRCAVQIFVKNRAPASTGTRKSAVGTWPHPVPSALNDRRFRAVPKVLETSTDPEPAADLRDLAVLRRLRALTAPRSRPPDGKAR